MASLGTALVTGASSGIGATYADRLAKRGYDLVLVARDRQRLEALAARLTAEAGVAVEVLTADLTERSDVRRVEDRIRADAAITLVVNNAGMVSPTPLIEADIDELETMIELNVVAAHRLAVAASQVFAKRGKGTIVNIASVVALIPEQFHGTYNATKAFILNLTQSLNVEAAPHGVRVQAVLPGLTRTEIFDRAGSSFDRFPPDRVMDVGDLVDAALAGLDQGETITVPSLPDTADWQVLTAARLALSPNLSRAKPAARYGVA